MTPSLWQKAKKKEEWKSWLKTQHSENQDYSIWSHHFMANNWGNDGNSDRLYFGGAPKSLQMVTAAMKFKKMLAPWKKSYHQLRQHVKKQRHYFANKGPPSQSYGFSNSHVWMWQFDYKESWSPKKGYFSTVELEKTLESPLDYKEIQPVHPKGNQSWIFIGTTDAKVETPILWPPDVKNWLIWEDPDAGKGWGWGEKEMTEHEMVGWHHWLSGHEFEQTLGVGDGQGRLACSSPWGCKESDMTEWLNWNELLKEKENLSHLSFWSMLYKILDCFV